MRPCLLLLVALICLSLRSNQLTLSWVHQYVIVLWPLSTLAFEFCLLFSWLELHLLIDAHCLRCVRLSLVDRGGQSTLFLYSKSNLYPVVCLSFLFPKPTYLCASWSTSIKAGERNQRVIDVVQMAEIAHLPTHQTRTGTGSIKFPLIEAIAYLVAQVIFVSE